MTNRRIRLSVLSAAAAAVLCCPWYQPPAARAAGDPAVEALGKEAAARGWILFGAHPQEIDSGKLIGPVDQRGQMDLYLARPDGSLLRNITRTGDFNEYGGRFSPDGRKIIYRRLPKERKVNHDLWGQFGELILADADGANPVVKGKEGELPWASWSPDGKQVACLYKKEGVIRIHDLTDGKVVREMPRQGIFQQLFWSPDGKRLVGTANVAGQQWNIVAIDLATQKLTLLSRALNCTPDWFQNDSARVIYSNRTPGITPRLGPQVNDYGFTVLMQAKADGSSRTLVYGRLNKHVYFGCTSPDGKYAIFGDDPQDGLIVGEMHVVRLADTPIVAPAPPFPELKERYPDAKAGPVLDLKLPGGEPLRGFEPHWTAREIPAKG
jgi:Tol biopolymer transport system component